MLLLSKKVVRIVCLVICGSLFLWQCEEQALNYLEKKKITSKSKVTSTSLEAPIISVIGQPPLRKENISNLIYPIGTMKLGEMRPVWKNETKSVPSTTFGNYLRVKLTKNFMEKEALINASA